MCESSSTTTAAAWGVNNLSATSFHQIQISSALKAIVESHPPISLAGHVTHSYSIRDGGLSLTSGSTRDDLVEVS